MNFENILLEFIDQIAIVTINRPEQLNALNKKTIAELSDCFKELAQNKKVRVVVLTGAGEKAFVAGADIKEFVNFTPEEGKKLSAEGQQKLFNQIDSYSKPVIAAINGFALGGGLELALACHIRIASENAKMGLPEVTLGLIPGYGGTNRLTQIVGKGKALEMMLSANMISASEALQCSLINHLVPQQELINKALELANKIAKNSPFAVSKVLETVHQSTFNQKALDKEIELFSECFGTPDFKEGTSSFIEKRKPNF